MIALLTQFWKDPTFASRVLKALILAAAMAVGTNQVQGIPPAVGAVLAALAALIKSGDRNPEPLRHLTDEEIERLRGLVKDK